MSAVALRRTEISETEQYDMRFQDHPAVQSRRDLFYVEPRKLKIDEDYNVRAMTSKETREHVAALKTSIIANGVKVPLEVRMDADGESLFVVAGHCRLAAVLAAIDEGTEIKAVPCIPEAKGTSEEDRIVNLVVSNSGKPLTPLEVAAVVKRLDAYGWTAKQMAEKLGWKSTNTVKQHLEMLEMPEGVKQHVREGNVSATTARQISKNADPVEAEKLIRDNLEENKRIKGKRTTRTRVTAKTIKRDREKGKAKPQENENEKQRQAGTVTADQTRSAAVVDSAEPALSGIEADRTAPQTSSDSGMAPDLGHVAQHETMTEWQTETDLLSTLIELTKQSHLCVQHNKSDDHPGWWSTELVAAIRKARDVIERLTGSPMQFEMLADPLSQDEAA